MVGWLDRLQRRSRVAGFLIAVIYKYVDDQGSFLAALITYYAFVSLFPALLLLTTVLGVVLVGHPELQEQILQSAVAQFPVIGAQLGQPQGLSGGTVGVVGSERLIERHVAARGHVHPDLADRPRRLEAVAL